MNVIEQEKKFTIYSSYYKLLKLLPKERESLTFKILQYVFEDKEPKDLSEEEDSIWQNLKRPINKSKKQSLNGSKGGAPLKNNNAKNKPKISQQTTQNTSQTISQKQAQSKMSYVLCNLENKRVNRGLGEEEKKETFKADDTSMLAETAKEVIEYLNQKTGSSFRHKTEATRKKINARLNEGYKLDDFIAVIDKKYDEWIGTEFEKYLCPETLFGTKFEKYLNQKTHTSSEIIPDWFDTTNSIEPLSEEEKQELEKAFKE